jgi:hypothetical protein
MYITEEVLSVKRKRLEKRLFQQVNASLVYHLFAPRYIALKASIDKGYKRRYELDPLFLDVNADEL